MSKPFICIGGALVDELFHATGEIILATTSNAICTRTPGGVARNIAHQLALFDMPVQLISVFGNDSDGEWLQGVCRSAGVRLDAALITGNHTGKYTGILQADGSLFTAFASNPVHQLITPRYLQLHEDLLKSAFMLLADANLEIETLAWLLTFSKRQGIPLVIEPVSVPHSSKLSQIDLNGLYMITPNEDELPFVSDVSLNGAAARVSALLEKGVENIWLHSGPQGSCIYNKRQTSILHAPFIEVRDCTGAGDGSLTGFLLGKYIGRNDLECLKIAHTLAAEILQVNGAIASHLNQQQLLNLVPNYFPSV